MEDACTERNKMSCFSFCHVAEQCSSLLRGACAAKDARHQPNASLGDLALHALKLVVAFVTLCSHARHRTRHTIRIKQHTAENAQYATHNTQHSTKHTLHDTQDSKPNTQHPTHNATHTHTHTHNNQHTLQPSQQNTQPKF